MRTYRTAGLSLILMALLAMTPVPTASQQVTPPAPMAIDTRDAPALGKDTAPVTIVEFADFQCAFCARGAKSMQRLLVSHPNEVRWVFKHYPLRIHPEAALAHEAAIAAQEQGKFWEMHALIFRNPMRIGYGRLVGYAQQIGLDVDAFRAALDSRRLRPRVVRDIEEAHRLGVAGTPTYFINGTRYVGARTTGDLRLLVDAIIRPPASASVEAGRAAAEISGAR
jgi:protein-disulfide isomerase